MRGAVLRGSSVTSDGRVAVLLVVVVLILFGPLVATETAQPASRYSLTAALADHHSVDLGPYKDELGFDRADYNGHLRSDKAPGQPLLAVPVYLVGRAFGAQSATHVHVHGDLGLWWVNFWTSLVPFAILIALMFLLCARFTRRRVAIGVAVAFGIGSIMLPIGVNLFGHDLAALFGFGAWMLIAREPISPRAAALAGLLGGMALLTEYETAIIVAALAGYLFVRHRARLGWFALGAIAPLGVLAWYDTAAFGAPWHTPPHYAPDLAGKPVGYSVPGVHALWDVLFGGRGLSVGAPLALVALAGAIWLATSASGTARRHAVVGLAIVIPYLVLTAGWSGFAFLEDPGPRYLIPALPFLAVPLALVWDRVWRPATLFAVWGAVIAVSAAVTYLLIPIGQSLVPELPRRVVHAKFEHTLWSMAFGRVGAVLYAVSALLAIVLFARQMTRAREPSEQMFAPAASTH